MTSYLRYRVLRFYYEFISKDKPDQILDFYHGVWFRWDDSDGLPHRNCGPAIICGDGAKLYYVNGSLHNTNGPAITGKNEQDQWYLNDYNVTYDVLQWMKDNDITYPFSKQAHLLFQLTFL